jgi:hypothetical protein
VNLIKIRQKTNRHFFHSDFRYEILNNPLPLSQRKQKMGLRYMQTALVDVSDNYLKNFVTTSIKGGIVWLLPVGKNICKKDVREHILGPR